MGGLSIAASVVEPASVAEVVENHWGLALRRCRFWKLGQNDTYLADSEAGGVAIRIYRHGRDPSSIAYELDLIDHLASRGVPAVASIPTTDGRRGVDLATPEGIRHLVVFPAAEGVSADLTRFPAAQYGQLVGALHREADGFKTDHHRAPLDLAALLDAPAQAARPWLDPDDASYLDSAVGVIHERLGAAVTEVLDWGPCHNDVIGNTVHRADGSVSLFDLDSCGPGWRAYELASILLQFGAWGTKPETLWSEFITSYRAERRIAESDLAAAAIFVSVRYIWLLGLHAGMGDAEGHIRDAGYLPPMMGGLRRWLPPSPLPVDPLSLL